MNPNSSAVSAQTSSPLGHHHGASNEINKFYMSSLLNLNHDGMANIQSEPAGALREFFTFVPGTRSGTIPSE